MKKKVCILPFTKEQLPFVINLPENYEIAALISAGTDICDIDIATLVNRNPIGIKASADLREEIDKCEVVIISDITNTKLRLAGDNPENPLSEFVHTGIEAAISAEKDIICFSPLELEDQESYKKKCSDNGSNFRYFNYFDIKENDAKTNTELSTPVIFIGEMTSNCDGYEIFLMLINQFKKDGLKVAAISENRYNFLYNQYCIKFWSHIDPLSNISNIKSYIKELEKELYPDVFLIKLPEPMTKFSETFPYDYGMTAYLLSQALCPDYFLYCGLYQFLDAEFITNINDNFIRRLGYSISAIHFSNQIIDFSDNSKDRLKTMFMPMDNIMPAIEQLRATSDLPTYNLLDNEQFIFFYNNLKTELFDVPYGVVK